jgi:EAL and modified HD-GYP domain-containing signal transduction protein
MDVHIARQPIFDSRKKIFADELLLRQFQKTNGDQLSGDRVTTNLLSSAFLTEDIEKIIGSKPWFIDFSEKLLLKEVNSIRQAFIYLGG